MKIVEAALVRAERQAEDQGQQLHKVEDQLTDAKKQIGALKKKLEKAEEVAAQAE